MNGLNTCNRSHEVQERRSDAPELKIVEMQAKSLPMESVYLHETRNKREKKRIFDTSMKCQFILTGLNVRVTRAEYMGEDYGGNA